MSSDRSLGELFQNWQSLNKQAGASFGQFDFSTIRGIREKQRKLEDSIYSILLENAPDNIKKILPEDCGEMEIGFNISDNIFYFLMYDPEQDEDEDSPVKIIALTIDSNKTVKIIKDFKID